MPYVIKNHDRLKKSELYQFTNEIDTIMDQYNLGQGYLIEFDICKRTKTAAGRCTYTYNKNKEVLSCRITVSYDYYKEFGFERTIGTLRHELSHLIDFVQNKKSGHGPTFKKLCFTLGGTMNHKLAGFSYGASATDKYIPSKPRKYKYVYTCKCGVKVTRGKRISSKIINRSCCCKCKTDLSQWSVTKVSV